MEVRFGGELTVFVFSFKIEKIFGRMRIEVCMNPQRPTILRKRLIPLETVDLKSDIMLYRDELTLITKWQTIRPKTDFSHGVSFYFLDQSYKVSRFYKQDGSFLYWYCDMIEVNYHEETDTFLMIDLLLDIKVFPDGHVEVLDEDELAEALEKKLITEKQYNTSKKSVALLLDAINQNAFPPPVCLDTQYW